MTEVTSDFSKFGWRERRMAATLLTASCDQGFPEDFNDDEVTIFQLSVELEKATQANLPQPE